ncbi:hypothetical protein [Peribacillus frigoritolerans]|uniref:hypothetical protein n=1 Tax=Peribacillus frigoritolerans TaxID=450367 RepID=UPI0021CE7D18|nr:hypothetical protein [Peribacillus frigoritolerans]
MLNKECSPLRYAFCSYCTRDFVRFPMISHRLRVSLVRLLVSYGHLLVNSAYLLVSFTHLLVSFAVLLVNSPYLLVSSYDFGCHLVGADF